MSNVVVATQGGNAPALHASPMQPRNFSELMQFADLAARSGMVPKDYTGKPQAIVIACQMGAELGLAPMQSLQNIAVINGRPSVWGDTLLALVRSSPVCDDVVETIEGEGQQMVATCTATRKGKKPVVGRFSMADAHSSGLAGKPGPWKQYPRRMLQMRARGFALRDAFPDVLRGLITAEEAQDMPMDAQRNAPQEKQRPAKNKSASEDVQARAAESAERLASDIGATASRSDLEQLTSDQKVQKTRAWLRKNMPHLEEKITAAVEQKLASFEDNAAPIPADDGPPDWAVEGIPA